MKVLFITDNFPPEVNAPATRTYEHCKEWVESGAEVTVITCAPNFPQGKVYPGYSNKLYDSKMVDGIRVIRVWSYIVPNSGFAKRILDFTSFAMSAILASLFIKTDLIVATSPQFFAAIAGRISAGFKRKPWIMEVRDLWPESIKAVDALSDKKRIFDWLERIELNLYQSATSVVVVTNSFKENLVGRGIREEKIHVIFNGINLDSLESIQTDSKLPKKLGLEGKFIVSYIGTHGMAHKLDFLIEASRKFTNDSILILMGDGAEKSNLVELAESTPDAKVMFLPNVPKEQVYSYIAMSDVCLVNLKNSPLFKTVIPSKIFENAAYQKPILLGVEGESAAIIQKFGAGLCFKPEDEKDLLQNLNRLQNDKALYITLQHGCLSLAKAFNRKTLAAQMLAILRVASTEKLNENDQNTLHCRR